MKKKLLKKIGLGAGTLAVIIAGAAAFSAFEAHVVNVTATIENALEVPLELRGMDYGTVFPEEVLHQNLDINLSGSFLTENRVDDVEYMIRQKPKCGIPIPQTDPVQYSGFVQVEHGLEAGTFVCPEVSVPQTEGQPLLVQSVALPLLCPFLSKHEMTTDGTEQENDGAGIDAFHGPLTGWTQADSVNTQVLGRLVKAAGDSSDTWDIDLHVPAFEGQVAQDGVIPEDYLLDPALEHQVFGCDLWVEVTEISLPGEQPENGTLTVTKVVEGGDAAASTFSFTVNGGSSQNFEADGSNSMSVAAGTYDVVENAAVGYTTTYSNSLNANANCDDLAIAASGFATCTITNTFTPLTGTLTVTKVVVGSNEPVSSFALFVDGGAVVSGAGNTVSAGGHVVSETPNPAYSTVISGDCDLAGNVSVPANSSASCTVTNTLNGGTITITKVVNQNGVGTASAGSFQMTIDGGNVPQNTANPVTAGSHTVAEVANAAYDAVIGGDCALNGVVVVAPNQNATCTVTNNARFGTITVNKVVTNDDGGNAVVANFTLFVGATGVTSGASNNFAPGTYHISETGVSGYAASFSGACSAAGHNITIAAGESKTCTITNNDIAPIITLIKNVVGGTATANQFVMTVDGDQVSNNTSVVVTANANHTIDENAFPGYNFTSISGAGCPGTIPGVVNLPPGASITCTITNTATAAE